MSSWEAIGRSNEWYTPKYIFDAMPGVRFDLDVAAPVDGPRYVPCHGWLSSGGLEAPWHGFVWMNPPYGARNGLAPWLSKFISHGNGVALVPDRTSAPWFQDAAPHMDAVIFVSPKIKFERPDGSRGRSPGTGSVLMGIGERALLVLSSARLLGWSVTHLRRRA
jgi:hypothetical protein